jgi:hypothetical protein
MDFAVLAEREISIIMSSSKVIVHRLKGLDEEHFTGAYACAWLDI